MHPLDFREYSNILLVAPGEGNTPLSMFEDKKSEYLAINCGQERGTHDLKEPVHYSTFCKWELRHVDRRVGRCIPNIFYKIKRLQIKPLRDRVSLAIRKCRTKGKKIKVSELLSPGGFENIIKYNEGYHVLRRLRGTPPYWEQTKHEILQ